MSRPADPDVRVLILAPVGRDAALTRDLLGRHGIASEICGSIDDLCDQIELGAAAAVLTEEVFEDERFDRLPETLRDQPAWSDIAVLLFAGAAGAPASARTLALLERFPNVTLLDRPIRVTAAISVVRAAIRGRTRQLELRDLLVALHASRSRAEEASRLKDEFLATLSHELRTPLNAILGWTTMLRNGDLDPARIPRALEVIDRNARAQTQLVEDVLDMARIITGKLRVELAPVALRGVVEAAVEAVRPAAEAKGIELVLDTRVSATTIRADFDRIQQVFWNLLSNAVKFTPAGGTIRVVIEAPDSHLVVTVCDTGIGIEPEFLPYVFDRFRQADQSVTRGHGGLGLGLAIVKHLVELHGGTVGVTSPGLGEGTSFRVTLPVPAILDEPVPGIPRGEREALAFRFHGRRVLVVDDDAATREMLAELFGHAGAEVNTADSSAAALALLSRSTPDVIIADIGMPGEDGCAFMRRVRGLGTAAAGVPSIALSAYTRSEDRASTRQAGFSDFVGKPASPRDLLGAVERLLRPRA